MKAKNTKTSPIDKALAKVARGRRRLETEQGMVARRNARTEMLGSMRELRRVLDRDYPNIPKKRKPRRKTTRIRPGYVLLASSLTKHSARVWLTWLAEAQVSIQVIRSGTVSAPNGTYIPEWASAIILSHPLQMSISKIPAKLKRAKRDRAYREVELSAYKLRKDS